MTLAVKFLQSSHPKGLEPFICPLPECPTDFPSRWNRALENARYPHLHQSYEWAALRARLGWEAEFVGITRNDDILAGAAILSRTLPAYPFRIATAPCGPFWSPGNEHLVPHLLELIRRMAGERRIIFCRFNVPCTVEEFSSLAGWWPDATRKLSAVWSYWNLPRPQMDLDLRGSLDEVLSRMHQKTRYRYRTALRRGATAEIGTDADVAGLGKLMRELGRRKQIPTQQAGYFRALLDIFPRDRVALIVVRAHERFLGGQIVARLGSLAYALYAAVARDSEHYPSELLDVAAIRWAKERECNRLELGGTCTGWPPSPEAKGYGVYDYKRRLGAAARLLAPYLDLVYRPALYRAARLVEELGLPLLFEAGWAKFSVMLERGRLLNAPRLRVVAYRPQKKG